MNNILKEDKEFQILKDDIFYREGILEFLEENKNIDIIIIYEKLYGDINIIKLIKSIKKINNEIKIVFILETKNEELENLLKEENVKNFFYNDKMDIREFVIELKKTKTNNDEKLQEEIKVLKEIINKKDEQLLQYQKQKTEESEGKKIIVFTGVEKSGKSMVLNNFRTIAKTESIYQFMEINFDNFKEIKKLNASTYKFIVVCEMDYEKVKVNKKILDKLISENIISFQKVNIIFNKINKYSINSKIAKNIFKQYNIIGNIKLNIYADYLANKKNNYKKENNKLKRQYKNIIRNVI